MKTRTENLPELHPNTIAALAGTWRVEFTEDGTTSGTVTACDMSATYQARNVSGALVELVMTIRECRGVDMLRELYQESLAKLSQVAGIAVAVDDSGFPAQLSFAMKYARNPSTPRRRAVFQAWQHLASGAKITNHLTGETLTLKNPSRVDFHALAESFFGGKIEPRTLDGDLVEMALSGVEKRPRGKPRKAG